MTVDLSARDEVGDDTGDSAPPKIGPKTTRRARIRLLRACVLIGLSVVTIVVVQHPAWFPGSEHGNTRTDQQPPELSPTGRFILGDYGAPILQAADAVSVPAIDSEATIAALTAAHVNTYAYLICPDERADPRVSRGQWEQLPDFARRARAAGIDVLVYLVPPTEAPEAMYEPFGWDYVSWFDQIGRLASEEPSIKGIVLDDFGGNLVSRPSLGFHFTPAYVQRMTAAAHRHVPTLSFLPILYHHDLIGRHAVLSDFRQQVEGVVFPYFGYSDGRLIRGNTHDATLALAQGREVSDLLNCPSPAGCRQIVFPARAPLDDTVDVARWASRVIPLPNERRVLTFSVSDDGGSLERSSYRIQAVVGGITVATVNRGAGWNDRVLDITAATANTQAAQVELRIVRSASAPKNRITVQLGSVSVRGMTSDGGFARPVQTSSAVTSASVEDIPLIYMPYAKPLSAERGRGASPAYLQSVLNQMDVLRTQGRIAGSLVFKLPLAGSVLDARSDQYEVLARTYAQWLHR